MSWVDESCASLESTLRTRSTWKEMRCQEPSLGSGSPSAGGNYSDDATWLAARPGPCLQPSCGSSSLFRLLTPWRDWRLSLPALSKSCGPDGRQTETVAFSFFPFTSYTHFWQFLLSRLLITTAPCVRPEHKQLLTNSDWNPLVLARSSFMAESWARPEGQGMLLACIRAAASKTWKGCYLSKGQSTSAYSAVLSV